MLASGLDPTLKVNGHTGAFPFGYMTSLALYIELIMSHLNFTCKTSRQKIVNLVKSEGLYASQGGPIILSQIENEYQNIEAAFHEKGPSYVRWAAQMAVSLQTGVPWVMCKQSDAPDPVINTCNGMRCGETFAGPNSPNKPSMWTENWTSFYQVYGGEPYLRSAEDIAFHVALFIAKNGSYVNYYMYHGGSNFGRTASAFVTTSYYDQAPIDEYGLVRQPKWGHLKELHMAIKACSTSLLQGSPSRFSLGLLQEAFVFQGETEGCAAFLVNNNTTHLAIVQFQNRSFQLPPKSISILSDCVNITFVTAKVETQHNERTVNTVVEFNSVDEWEVFDDAIPNFLDASLTADALLEQMNATKDLSDYLWYTLSYEHNSSCTGPVLYILSRGHAAYAFINGIYVGGSHGNHDAKNFTLETPILLEFGMNNISILSVMTGLPDSGPFLESRSAGLVKVEIKSSDGFYDFTNYTWGYQIGLLGEGLQIYKEENLDEVIWGSLQSSASPRLIWYKTLFDAPLGNDPVALNLSTMGKGEVWINGQGIGRYWITFLNPKGNPSQTLYHVPRSFLKTSGNLLVLLEEVGGDPLQISLNMVSTTTTTNSTTTGTNVDEDVSYYHPPQ
ncbi:hypothetical protein Ancab_000435 [Ancistrocladus abbreviatus]